MVNILNQKIYKILKLLMNKNLYIELSHNGFVV